MKILLLTRLMSGFVGSVQSGHWNPTGCPAIYHLIHTLDQSNADLSIIFSSKSEEAIQGVSYHEPLSLEGLATKPLILPNQIKCMKRFPRINRYFSEFCQYLTVRKLIKKDKPDLVYIDRSNVLIGAFLSRFHRVPVFFRLLGTPPSLGLLLCQAAPSHWLYRWAYRSPFRMVLCSRDGSPGRQWMQRALRSTVLRKNWVNGVNPVDVLPKTGSLIRVVLIGRLNYLKRIDQAVRAILDLPASSINKLHVDIIGEGEDKEKITSLIDASSVADRFTLHGAMPHQNVLSFLLKSDILISLNTHGNLTNTVLEGIRCGLCLMLPEADLETGYDIDTYTVIPEDSVIRLKLDHLIGDLTGQLSHLVDHPELIRAYQKKIQMVSVTVPTWEQRIQNEMGLLKPYDFAVVISDLRGGGTQRVLERLLPEWVKQGKRIALITLDRSENDAISLPEGVDRIELGGISASSHVLMGLFANFSRIRSIRRVLRQLNVPLVISFLSAINILTILAVRRLPCHLIISERNDPAKQTFGKLWDWLRRRYYRHADIITANSHAAVQTVREFSGKTPCHYVPNPVVLPQAVRPILLDRPTILAVGRLHYQKAYDILIHAFARFQVVQPEWQLVILGEGDLRSQLTQLIHQLTLTDSVFLKGYQDPYPYFQSAKIFTMPSRYEGMPNALLEAMSMGMPAIISDALSGPLDFIRDRENALVVPVGSVEALFRAMLALAEDEALRSRLSDQSKVSMELFSMDNVLPQWEALFHA